MSHVQTMIRWLLPLTALGSFLGPFVVAAQPTITSASISSDGRTIIVSGSNFGQKSNAAPLLWDDFESGAAGQLVSGNAALVGKWDAGSGSENVRYSSSSAFSGTHSARHDFTGGAFNASLAKNVDFSALYLDFWARPEMIAQPCNWKVWRLYGNNDQLQFDWVFFDTSSANVMFSQGSFEKNYWGHIPYKDRTWHHFQLIYKASDPGVANGTFINFVDGEVDGANLNGSVVTRTTDVHLSQIRIGHFWSNDHTAGCYSPGAVVYTDNVYIDTTLSRVEVVDNASYAASRVKAIQPALKWSDGAISLNANFAGLSPGSTAYLFVFNERNAAPTRGYAISIPNTTGTRTPATARPTAPKDVSVQ